MASPSGTLVAVSVGAFFTVYGVMSAVTINPPDDDRVPEMERAIETITDHLEAITDHVKAHDVGLQTLLRKVDQIEATRRP